MDATEALDDWNPLGSLAWRVINEARRRKAGRPRASGPCEVVVMAEWAARRGGNERPAPARSGADIASGQTGMGKDRGPKAPAKFREETPDEGASRRTGDAPEALDGPKPGRLWEATI